MTDLALRLVKKMAKKLTIENTNGMVYFRLNGDMDYDGKRYDRPNVKIAENILDGVTEDTDEETLINALELVGE
jgi:hypothetical protein